MNFSALQTYLDGLVRDGLPMAQIVVTKGREVVFSHNAGHTDTEKTVPASDNTLCWCFSNSKVYTAVCLMRLVEEGKIGLDDPVSRYLPEYAEVSFLRDGAVCKTQKPVTIRQMITMTSGLSYKRRAEYPHFTEATAEPGVTTRRVAEALAKDVWDFEPGTDYVYGLGHDVIGAVIEVVTGMRFSEYMKQRIFDPLGIRDTGFHPDAEQLSRFAAMYRYDGTDCSFTPRAPINDFCFSENYDGGGAGLFSCPKEYRKLLTVLACGGTTEDGYRLLRPETIRQMATNQLNEKQLRAYRSDGVPKELSSGKLGYGYGLGVRVHVDPAQSGRKTSVGEFGWDGAAGAYSLVDPEKQLAVCYAEHVRHHVFEAANPKSLDVYRMIHPTLTDLVCEAIENG
ncbi:MAG: beta-lactamase family protein [Oscillospiraceae bacterium]|nr:beta-lactamase family protein [Oscillospiraceae bacterium]